jgi:hypothetical protein
MFNSTAGRERTNLKPSTTSTDDTSVPSPLHSMWSSPDESDSAENETNSEKSKSSTLRGIAALDPESYRRITDAKRAIWTAGFKGLAVGGIIGAVADSMYRMLTVDATNDMNKKKTAFWGRTSNSSGSNRSPKPSAFAKKYNLPLPARFSLVASTLIGATFGSFLLSSTAGRNAFNGIGDIFRMGANPKSTYMRQQYANEGAIREEHEDAFLRREAAIRKAALKKEFGDVGGDIASGGKTY